MHMSAVIQYMHMYTVIYAYVYSNTEYAYVYRNTVYAYVAYTVIQNMPITIFIGGTNVQVEHMSYNHKLKIMCPNKILGPVVQS